MNELSGEPDSVGVFQIDSGPGRRRSAIISYDCRQCVEHVGDVRDCA